MAEFALAELIEATARQVGERPAVLQGDRRLTYAALVERGRRLARWLEDRGLGVHRERDGLAGHESGQDLLAQYLLNGPEYLESLYGACRARVAPFNVNYRYTADELRHLLRDSAARVVLYHARFAPTLAEVLPDVPSVRALLQVADGSGHALLPGAVDYEDALAAVAPRPAAVVSPDDLYVLCTGGTTGRPKAVLWRQADAVVTLMNVRDARAHREWRDAEERLVQVSRRGHRVMPLAPLMHGAAQFAALQALCEGNTLVLPSQVTRLDPADAWETVARHEVASMSIVGDAFARPLADELDARPRALPSLRYLVSGGAALSARQRQRLTDALPGLSVVESMGSSETGVQGRSSGGARTFRRSPSVLVLAESRDRALAPGHPGTGWLATAGRVPLGYLGDAEKTARTFPVLDGMRLSVPGDRARLLDAETVELLGRDATTINTGGEKVFAEEVEAVLRAHPDVLDAVVCGRPSERWGAEVVAVVAAVDGVAAEDLVTFCAERLARYKLPKAVVFVDEVRRSPSGKPDLAWARTQVGDRRFGSENGHG